MSETRLSDDEAREAPQADSEEAFRRWETLLARTSLQEPEQGFFQKTTGFLRRTLLRVRDLGVSWELQRDLLRTLIDRQAALERRSTKDLETAVAELKASEANILGALDAMWKLHERNAERERERESNPGDLVNLRDRHEILRVRQTRLESSLADLREELATLRGGPSAPALPLSPADVAEVLADLEKEPEGERPGAVEVSFQDARAESLLLAARRHFGGRLSSSGSSYRGPNDLWIHADFTAEWSRPILLENAAARLRPGGRFVLVTAPGAGAPPRSESLPLAEDREVPLRSGGPVRVLGWIRE